MENTEVTLILLKPDGVKKKIIGDVLSRLEKVGLDIIGLKMVWPDSKKAGQHYADNEEWLKSMGEKTKKNYEEKGLPFDKTELEHGQMVRQQLMDFISSGPIVAVAAQGHNAISTVRKLVGATEPAAAAPGTIRGDYSLDTYRLADQNNRPITNIVHASSDILEAQRELNIWFSEEELYRA
ncbi:nucleoside-diphosphate kinase [Candidatus Microgenomates bacterium]|nr:nucleoside-diphosphate kinase [Candidatus Microgenomates bacterium]